MPKKIQHIIWDWNGTLLNDVWLCIECINSLLTERSLPNLSSSSYKQIFGFPVRDYYEQAGFDFAKEPFEVPAKQFIDLYNDRKKECSLNVNALDTLAFFHSLGIQQHILSASESYVLHEMMDYHQLSPFLNQVYGLDNHYADGKTGLGKQMIEELRLNPENTIMIGDTCHDQEVAIQLGINIILFTGGHYPRQRLLSCEAVLIDKLVDLKSIIQSL